MAGSIQSLALPTEQTLAAWAEALNAAGYWAYVYDASWRLVFVTDDLRFALGDTGPTSAVPIGSHVMSAEFRNWIRPRVDVDGSTAIGASRRWFSRMVRYILATTPGGRDELRGVIDAGIADLVDDLQPEDPPPVWSVPNHFAFAGKHVAAWTTGITISNSEGEFVGTCALPKPAASMTEFAVAVAMADPSHLERMRVVDTASRHPAAILMADLEASSSLSRRLSTPQYFSFVRRLVRAADEHVVALGGIVGRHAGDGMVALFLAETAGSESAAARSCIAASRLFQQSLADIAARSGIPPAELSLRFGLHWGATLYVGRIVTPGRSEVTALGDEMNEGARIEACATGGRILASKALIERLDPVDLASLTVDLNGVIYTKLSDLDTATEKARRDAPAIAVCDLADLAR